MVVRIAIAIGMLVMVGSASIASIQPASASQNRISITLSCDKDVSATVALTLLTDVDGEALGMVSDIRCGDAAPKQVRVVVPLPSAVNAIAVTQFDVTVADAVTCADGAAVTVPARIMCLSDGRGARLVAR